jgi:hypothetical protein
MTWSSSSALRAVLALILILFGSFFPRTADAGVSDSYGKLPLHFEANLGQTHGDVHFLSRGSGYVLYLTSNEAVFVLKTPNPGARRGAHEKPRASTTVLRMAIVDSNPRPQISGLDALPAKVNYFVGKDPAKWRSNVSTFARLHYRDVYPGIDLFYYGNQRQLEYDFIVAPGADPRRILLDFVGADALEIDAEGDLILHTGARPVRLQKPSIYQEKGGKRQEIAGRYAVHGANRVGFEVADYDRSRPLVIDPVFRFYSTYLGGERGEAIAVDRRGNAYITGFAGSTDFPTTPGAFQPNAAGGDFDAFVTKVNPQGTRIIYSTYLGGGGTDISNGIAVDADGHAYVVGATSSDDFPVTAGAFQTACPGVVSGSCRDAFVVKLNTDGSAPIYSTYLGGSSGAAARAVALDDSGSAYIAGVTGSIDFPTTPGTFQTIARCGGDVFVTKLNPSGSALIYSTYLGGDGQDDDLGVGIAVDTAGNAYVAGHTKSLNFPTTPGAFQPAYGGGLWDAFVTKLDPTGSTLVYSTYLGGTDFDQALAIAVDGAGGAYVTGRTASTNFPTVNAFQGTNPGGFRAFVTRLHASGSLLIYSTYLGGSSGEEANGIAVDLFGNAHVTGVTNSTDFPTTPGAFQPVHAGGNTQEAFLTKLGPSGSALAYSTFLGGTGYEVGFGIAVDRAGSAYITGETGSPDFPTSKRAPVPGFQGFFQDAFVTKVFGSGQRALPQASAK